MRRDGRSCGYTIIRRVEEEGAWADRALHAELARARLDPRERALATRLVYGVVQRRATLDHVIEAFSRRRVAQLDPAVLAALRLGVFQLGWLDRIPPHAAVATSVELAKRDAPHAAGFVNAVLRRAARELGAFLARLDDGTPEGAALVHSHPEWLVRLWWGYLGPDATRALLAADNRAAEAALRVNRLRTDPHALLARLGVRAHTDPAFPDALVLDEPFDAFGTPEWRDGLYMPQSRAAQAIAPLLAPRAGERVLDLCAAPGGKTTHLAALMGDAGEIVAVERHPGRAEALRRTAARTGATSVRVETADAAAYDATATFDRVLVDPPCSDLGTLAARPDARWRKAPEDLGRLARLQGAILAAGARAVRPGGVLVYSTCTISPGENEDVVRAFLASAPGFEPDRLGDDRPIWQHPHVPEYLLTLPHCDRTDGFFVARLRRRA